VSNIIFKIFVNALTVMNESVENSQLIKGFRISAHIADEGEKLEVVLSETELFWM
jgi:hypothetical protein